ncbi:MAG: DUF6569 family protein [Bacteroidota bacterium]
METQVTSVQTHKNLGVVQIATADRDLLQYISSHTAIKDKQIEVREIGEGGVVNTLLVENHWDCLIFMMDGDVLAGAKQNRVLNTSVLLAPHSTTKIPVSCVERGRWRHTSDSFSSRNYSAPSFLRAQKAQRVTENLKQNRGHVSQQGEVWEGVDRLSMMANVHSPTDNLFDVFEKKGADVEDFIAQFSADPGANGVVMFMDHHILCADLFHRVDIYHEYFPRLLRGVALEAFFMRTSPYTLGEAEALYKAQDLFDRYDTLPFQEFPGVGVGTERRFSREELTGCELRYERSIVHLTVLSTRSTGRRAA